MRDNYLKPCPECKGIAYGISTSRGSWVECSQCGFKTHVHPNYGRACDAWNDYRREPHDQPKEEPTDATETQ